MTTLSLWVATLAGALLIVAGIVGSRPRPSDGQWVPLSAGVRAGLTVIGLLLVLGGWGLYQGWFKSRPVASAPRAYAEVRSDRPVDSLWNEAEVAERDARLQPKPQYAPTTPTPALEPVPATAAAPVASTALLPATAQASSAAPVAVPATARQPAAAATTAPPCNCDPAQQPAAAAKKKPTTTASRPPSAPRAVGSRSGVVSVCDLQQRYGITAAHYGAAPLAVRSSSAAVGSGSVRILNRLGPQQRREQLRITLDGGASGSLNLGPAAGSGSLSLRVPATGARYRVSGFTEYADGRRVPLSGEGWLDAGTSRYEVRVADEGSGNVFLEPAS